jgi:hypothetical protein
MERPEGSKSEVAPATRETSRKGPAGTICRMAFLAWTRPVSDGKVPKSRVRVLRHPGAIMPHAAGLGSRMGANNAGRQFRVEPPPWSADASAYRRFLDQTVTEVEAESLDLQRLREAIISGSVSLDDARRAIAADEAKQRRRVAQWTKLRRRVQRSQLRRATPVRCISARRSRRPLSRRRARHGAALRAKGPPEPPEPDPHARRARWLAIIRRGGRHG